MLPSACGLGQLFKTSVTVFHYTDRPKPVNNLFIFSSLSNDFVYSREKTHASVTVTVVRDGKIRTALRTNQIAEFVTVTAWKKNNCFYLHANAQSILYPCWAAYASGEHSEGHGDCWREWRSFSNSNKFYIHFFSSFFYLNISPCYNTYITYSLTDIGSKINWQFTSKNINIAFIFTISFLCSGKRNKTVWKKRKKKVLKNENIYIKKKNTH